MLKGFKEFLLRGNVVDLAVAVVIGGAFTALVTVFGAAIINPLIAALGGPESVGLGFEIVAGNEATFVDVGAVITALITFTITAAVIYFVFVAPMKAYQSRLPQAAPEDPAEVVLLTEIRDLLAHRDDEASAH